MKDPFYVNIGCLVLYQWSLYWDFKTTSQGGLKEYDGTSIIHCIHAHRLHQFRFNVNKNAFYFIFQINGETNIDHY